MITIITGFQEVPCLQYAGHTLKTGYFFIPGLYFQKKKQGKTLSFFEFCRMLAFTPADPYSCKGF